MKKKEKMINSKKVKLKPKGYLILKNVFKSVFKNKVQIFGLAILIFLSALIFTIMNTTTNRVQNAYYQIIKKSNLHDFIIDDKLIRKNLNQTDINVSNSFTYKQKVLETIRNNQIKKNNGFDWEFKETRLIININNGNTTLFKAIMSDQNSKINKLVIFEGRNIEEENEIVMSYEFAKKNNYKLNQCISLQNDKCDSSNPSSNNLWIVGFGNSAEYTYPQLNITTPIPNQKYEALIYVHPKQFGYFENKYSNNISLSSLPDKISDFYIDFGNNNRSEIKNKDLVSRIKSEIIDHLLKPFQIDTNDYNINVIYNDEPLKLNRDSSGNDTTDLSNDKVFKIIITPNQNVEHLKFQDDKSLEVKLISKSIQKSKTDLKDFKNSLNDLVFNIDKKNYNKITKKQIDDRIKLVIQSHMFGFTANSDVNGNKDYDFEIFNNNVPLLAENNILDENAQLKVKIRSKENSTILKNETEDLINVNLKKYFKYWNHLKSKQKIDISSNEDREGYFVAKWHNNQNRDFNKIATNLKQYFTNNMNSDEPIVFKTADSGYRFYGRVNVLPNILYSYKITAMTLLIITLAVSLIVILLITKKRVESSKMQIGILKSLGYSSRTISLGYLIYPLVAALIGGGLGYFIGLILQIPIINIFSWYFAIPLGNFSFDIFSLFFSLIILFIILGIFSSISIAIYISGNPLRLIRSQEGNKAMSFTKVVSYINRGKKFETRFRGAIFSKSISKVLTIAFVMLLSTILMTFSIAAPKSLQDMKNATYKGINYRSVTEYETPVWNSPLSSYALYNPDYNNPNYGDEFKKGVSSDLYSRSVMIKDMNSERYKLDASALLSMANLNYAILDINFYLKAKLLDTNYNDISALKQMVCSLAIPDWDEERDGNLYSLSDCLLKGPIKNSPYFVQNKLYDLVNALDQIDYEFAKKAIEDMRDAKKTKGKILTDERYNEFKEILQLKKMPPPATDNNDKNIDDKKWTDNQKLKYYIRKYIFLEIRNRLNNPSNSNNDNFNDVDFNRYTGQTLNYFKEISKNLGFEKAFNIQFGVLPFNEDFDELATYLEPKITKINNEGNVRKLNFKAYGISRNTNMHILLDNKNNNLIDAMYKAPTGVIPIIINQSLAKAMNIENGDELEVDPNRKALFNSDRELVKVDNWFFPPDSNWNEIKNSSIADNELYQSDGFINRSSLMAKMANNEQVYISKETNYIKNFKVIGIQEGYGEPKMFLQKEQADVILGLIDDPDSSKTPIKDKRIEVLKRILGKNKWDEIKNDKEMINKNLKKILPPFNAKFSKEANIRDIIDGISIVSSYGDYTKAGLDGFKTDSGDIQLLEGLGKGAISFALPIAKHQSVLEEITGIAESALYVFVIIAIFVSLVIILITSNLIISENIRLVSTMKVIGYNNIEITKVTMGIYLPIILLSFAIGFPSAWFLLGALINALASNTMWIMPFYFSWWIIFAVFAIVIGIYLFSFLVGWYLLKKVNLVEALKIEE